MYSSRRRAWVAVGAVAFTIATFLFAQVAMPPEVKPEATAMAAIRELEKRLEMQRKYEQDAIEKAVHALETRLEGMNEFRAQLKEQGASFATRDMLASELKGLDGRLRALEDAMGQQKSWIAGALAVFGLVMLILKFVVPPRIRREYVEPDKFADPNGKSKK